MNTEKRYFFGLFNQELFEMLKLLIVFSVGALMERDGYWIRGKLPWPIEGAIVLAALIIIMIALLRLTKTLPRELNREMGG